MYRYSQYHTFKIGLYFAKMVAVIILDGIQRTTMHSMKASASRLFGIGQDRNSRLFGLVGRAFVKKAVPFSAFPLLWLRA